MNPKHSTVRATMKKINTPAKNLYIPSPSVTQQFFLLLFPIFFTRIVNKVSSKPKHSLIHFFIETSIRKKVKKSKKK